MAAKSETTSGLKTATATPAAVRPRYRERQVLRAADLQAEQSYLIEARRRHNIGQHGWGIVCGLEIVLEILDTPELVVQPGVAVDGYGRELIVAAPVRIPAEAFDELGNETLDVWLVYELMEANVPQRGSWSCGPGKNTRATEHANLRLISSQTPERPPTEVPREPIEVPSADLPFLPHRIPPDDPSIEWPIYLGTINRLNGPNYDPRSPRPFATLTGELVTAPSGVARMQVGSELQNDSRLFAVTLANTAGKSIERVGIDREGNTFLTGNTTVKKSLTDANSSELHVRVGPARMLNFRPLAATPAAAAPWQVYRTSVKEGTQTVRQLRFEIAHPGDKAAPELSRLVIGKRDAAGVFSACFTISADCTLTIEGDLNIAGQLVEGQVEPDATDPRFAGLIAQNWLVGTTIGETGATTGTIQGTVTDSNRVPLPNVSVELKSDAVTTNTVTDSAGRFVATGIPIGGYNITAAPTGFKPKVVQTTLDRGGTAEVLLMLEEIQFGTINGSVVDANGAVIVAATVELTNTDTNAVRLFSTNALGRFSAPQMPAGNYSIRVAAAGFTPVTRVLPPNQTIDVTLTVTPGTPTPP